MNEDINKWIKQINGAPRKIGIFGTGNLSGVAEEYLQGLGIGDYVYFDNDVEKQKAGLFHGRETLDPKRVSEGYFVLVSTAQFDAVRRQLEGLGLKELEDYIYVLELEYYDALLHYDTAPRAPGINNKMLGQIEKALKQYVDVERAEWFEESGLLAMEKEMGFEEIYHKRHNVRYRRKMMEYYAVDKMLGFQDWGKDDIYIDIGAAGSPFAKWLRERRGIMAYGLDLEEGAYSHLDYYLQEDATHMHFADSSVRAISMQSAFETFAGDADTRFISEAARVLKKGGKAVIVPLYMHEKHLCTVSPNYYKKGYADEGALECIRTDCRAGLRSGRFYSVDALEERILKVAEKNGLEPKIDALPDELVERDGFVYLKFILCLEKR